MLALNGWNVAVGGVGKIPSHDKHLRVLNNVAGEKAVRCSGAWLVGIPLDPFESRHSEHVYVVETLDSIQDVNLKVEMVLTVAFSPKPKPP